MYQGNIAELVRDALVHAGCDQKLISDLDPFSPILIDLNDLPGIYIGMDDEGAVFLWSNLAEYNEHMLEHSFQNLFKEHMGIYQFYLGSQEGGQVGFCVAGEFFQLRARVALKFLESPEGLSEVLNHFFEILARCVDYLK